ncbi:hypothetical protein ACVDG3_21830 [Meridianimarinicoccus sp. RP-17]|uniref:hypothetical protein n=1 Tax=Meridianimarinicoccus zhengii TaxID=2056810 RepID=UPI0013A6CA57|nr:hypothetical protein [Phycocomes zhengii]
MVEKEVNNKVWAPFSPLNLALSAASEIGITSASDTLGIPQGAGLIFSVGAAATIEVIGNYFAESKRILRTASPENPNNPLPKAVRNELTEESISSAIQLIESNEARMTRLIYQKAMRNPTGLGSGISLIHLV